MRVPLEWLKKYVSVEASAEEVATLLTMGGLEVEAVEPPEEVRKRLLKRGVDPEVIEAAMALAPVLDVYVTPNRGDCLSMVGVAREVAALYDLPLHIPAPFASEPGGEAARLTSVTIEDPDLCPRYAARLGNGVKIGPSPIWMQAHLEAVDQRAINNVVDVTNYVMLELGQPLHAFDFDKLAGRRIVVRQAREGETISTLDGEERALTPPMLVIADAEKPVAVAGVMGGADTEVSDGTTTILLESAHFDPLSVRRTSRALALRTEASYRFERVVDPNGVQRAVDRACELLAQIGQPEAASGIVDVYPKPITPRVVPLRIQRVTELLGMAEITPEIAADCLGRLELSVEADPDGTPDPLVVRAPTFRPDITLEEDLIEEIGRIYGYENIPETLPVGMTTRGGDSAEGRFLMELRRLLVRNGLQEVVTHSLGAPSFFDSPDDAARRIAVRNALSAEVGGLRRSLLPGLLEIAQHNAARGRQAMALFEVGRVWQNEAGGEEVEPSEYLAVAGLLTGPLMPAGWDRTALPPSADFWTTRGIVERLLAGLGIEDATFAPSEARSASLPQFHPGRTAFLRLTGERPEGVVGEVHPRLAAASGLRERLYLFEISVAALQHAVPADGPRYHPLSRYQAITRDLAPRVLEAVPYGEVESAVHAAAPALLEEFRLTDVFRGGPLPEGMKSFTLSFTFRSPESTLTEADVTDALARLREALELRCGASFAL